MEKLKFVAKSTKSDTDHWLGKTSNLAAPVKGTKDKKTGKPKTQKHINVASSLENAKVFDSEEACEKFITAGNLGDHFEAVQV